MGGWCNYQRCTGLVLAFLAASCWTSRPLRPAARRLHQLWLNPRMTDLSQSSWSRWSFWPGSIGSPQRTHGVP